MSKPFKTLGNGLARWLSLLASRLPMKVESHPSMPKRALAFIFLTASLGAAVLASGALRWESHDSLRFACYLVVAMLASGFKVQLPGIDGTQGARGPFVVPSPNLLPDHFGAGVDFVGA